jgi:hypothetical protein
MILLDITSSRITTGQWSDLTTTLIYLWSFVGSIVMFAGSLLIGHGLIPSLTSTRDLPASYINFRPIALISSAFFLLCAIFCFVNFVDHMTVVYDIFNRVWI